MIFSRSMLMSLRLNKLLSASSTSLGEADVLGNVSQGNLNTGLADAVCHPPEEEINQEGSRRL